MEFSKTIHGSGKDLLHLINDILDLSKIESGTVTLDLRSVPLREVRETMERTFRHVAQNKGVGFEIELATGLPSVIQTDSQRLDQVLKNLFSNAFKFTERGRVTLRVAPATSGWSADQNALHHAAAGGSGVISFSVTDTGIGIAPEKQSLIFEAFQQADGSTSRKYGGTGLGLAISREIARLLGGELTLMSAVGQGSTFTLFVPAAQTQGVPRTAAPPAPRALPPPAEVFEDRPISFAPAAPPLPVPSVAPANHGHVAPSPLAGAAPVEIADDRSQIQPGDRTLLIIEDDPNFAPFLCEMGRLHGFKCLVASGGQAGLALARQYKPSAITLDLSLADIDGWRVLDRLKSDLVTRHIPVLIISVSDEPERGLKLGSIGFITKPAGARGPATRHRKPATLRRAADQATARRRG